MSKKTLFIFVTVFAVLLCISGNGTIVLGQEKQNEPTFGQRFKNAFRNIFRDDDGHNHDQSGSIKIAAKPSATPMQPPKPLTSEEIKQSQGGSTEKKTGTSALQRNNNTAAPPTASARILDSTARADNDVEGDATVFDRLRAMRQPVFNAEAIDALSESPAVENTTTANIVKMPVRRTTPAPTHEPDDPFLIASRNSTGTADVTDGNTSNTQTAPAQPVAEKPAVEKRDSRIPQRITRTDTPKSDDLPKENDGSLKVSANNTIERDTSEAVSEKNLVVSPRLELTTEGPPKTVVNQEAVYKIRITNNGNASADMVSLSAEIPNWIEIRSAESTSGKALTIPRDDNPQIADLTWKISRIEAGKSELLVLRLVPQQRKTVDLRIKYDFYRPTAVAKIDVEEPILSLELQGPDEVLWGTAVLYTLLVRNTGNGSAEDVHLELLQTGSEMKECVLPVLAAGEEQPIDIKVWTGKQEYIDINIQADGKYNLKANVSKRVSVRRPSIELHVETPSVQFLGNAAEFVVSVRNDGNAAAKDLEVKALIPLGTQFVSCDNGGAYNSQKSEVLWKIPALAIGESYTAKVVCNAKTEGECKLSTVVSDQGGVLAEGSGSFAAEAVVKLKLNVESPSYPVEVGKDTFYTIHVKNEGTKLAENVAVMMVLDRGLEPVDVEGGDAEFFDGQVIFDKKTSLPAGQELTLKVKTKADIAENLRVRTEVICTTANVHLVDEHATYFYAKKKP
ncbi:hypothetical protein FACS1894170_08510 [Planctomycetales bacterium]|nr:hypothetical protein FACS1894170_08510 [Planctomycetales bacterium]